MSHTLLEHVIGRMIQKRAARGQLELSKEARLTADRKRSNPKSIVKLNKLAATLEKYIARRQCR